MGDIVYIKTELGDQTIVNIFIAQDLRKQIHADSMSIIKFVSCFPFIIYVSFLLFNFLHNIIL